MKLTMADCGGHIAILTLITVWLHGWSVAAGSQANCPPGFVDFYDGSCYFYSHDYESWTGALISCSVLEGHLIEIETLAEFKHIQNSSQQHGQCGVSLDHSLCETRWVGLSSKRDPAIWEWATSHTIYDSSVFNMWSPGEPDNRKGQSDESCAVLDYYPDLGHSFTLADVNCHDPRHRYICEFTTGFCERIECNRGFRKIYILRVNCIGFLNHTVAQ